MLLTFLYTAVAKLLDHNNFRFALEHAPHLKRYSGVIAWLLPVLELAIAALLFFPVTRVKGVYAALLTMSVFTTYLIYMLVSGSDLPCNCGGVISSLSWGQHILFNLFLMLLLTLAIFLYDNSKNRQLKHPLSSHRGTINHNRYLDSFNSVKTATGEKPVMNINY